MSTNERAPQIPDPVETLKASSNIPKTKTANALPLASIALSLRPLDTL